MPDNNKELDKLRHSAAHLLAASVLELFPGAQNAIGPTIENGFYQDFDTGKHKISLDDLPKIEKKMRELLKNWNKFNIKKINIEQARKDFANNPYKLELAEEFAKEGKKLTETKQGDFLDLCKGGHLRKPKDLKHFKLTSLAGAYWRGNEKNKMLTRIYGTAWKTEKDLLDYLERVEIAKERDHRKIGKELDLFTFSEIVGKGLPLFTQKGATIWREIERFVVDEEIKRGYLHVKTPNIAKTDLYRKSGHFPYYKDTMYPPMKIDEEELILRPMTCPHHFSLYMDKPRSYRDLPVRIAELASLYRYEKSGELTGLIRVREFTLADSHNIVRKEEAEKEINFVLDLIEYVSGVFGLKLGKHYVYRLSLGDRSNKEKYYDSPKDWDLAEGILRKVIKDRKSPGYEAANEAAFYGPKIDVQMKNVLGKEDTAFTVQYDFCLPERFKLEFINERGEAERPVVIHRSSVGAMERSIAFLIEHFAGNFPVWLSPTQVVVLPITDRNIPYAKRAAKRFLDSNIRVELDDRSDTLGNKIRQAQEERIPYMVIIGDKEEKANKVSIRLRSEKDLGQVNVDDFVLKVRSKIDEKSLEI